ncbi:Mitochondrial import inner membrane translocase subunit tim8 [Trichoderma virens FT-333]|nr:Mitochondrial import inner membrane translocase subunit tim8 [Trichoderma virens FT-333]
MNAAQTGIENLDLEKLNDKDKTELRQFLANEQQRSQIQAHLLEEVRDWKYQGAKLEKGEEGCLANCVDRFLDINFLTMKHLNNMRS